MNTHATLVFTTLLLAFSNANAAKDGVEKYGSWFYQCQKVKVGKICGLRHVQLFKNKSHALTLAIFDSASFSKVYMHFKVPLGVYLPDGLSVSVDSGKPRIAQYQECNKSGCTGMLDYNESEIRAIKAGKKMRVVFTHRRGKKKAELNVPLDGAGAGIDKAWKSKNAVQNQAEPDGSGGAAQWFKGLFQGATDSAESE